MHSEDAWGELPTSLSSPGSQNCSATGVRVFGLAGAMSNLNEFVTASGAAWGQDHNAANVTDSATFTAAVGLLRTPAGRNPSTATWANPPRWAAFELLQNVSAAEPDGLSLDDMVETLWDANIEPLLGASPASYCTAVSGDSDVCEHDQSSLRPALASSLGLSSDLCCGTCSESFRSVAAVFWLGCGTFSFTTMDPAQPAYWAERWCGSNYPRDTIT